MYAIKWNRYPKKAIQSFLTDLNEKERELLTRERTKENQLSNNQIVKLLAQKIGYDSARHVLAFNQNS